MKYTKELVNVLNCFTESKKANREIQFNIEFLSYVDILDDKIEIAFDYLHQEEEISKFKDTCAQIFENADTIFITLYIMINMQPELKTLCVTYQDVITSKGKTILHFRRVK